MKKIQKSSFLLVLCGTIATSIFFYNFTFAQTADSSGTPTCNTAAEKAVCQSQLNELNQEIAQNQLVLTQKQAEGESLQNEIDILNAKIKDAQLKIKAHNLAISQLGQDIDVRTENIQTIGGQINQDKDSLGQILKQTKAFDDISLPEVLLSGQGLSNFFADLDSFDSIKTAMADTFTNLQSSEAENQKEEDTFTAEQNQEIDEKVDVQKEEAVIQDSQTQEKQLLALNKNQQAGYQAVIAQKTAQADKIKAALFSLANTSAIPFGTALQYAEEVQKATGVDPAFLLAIITQESSLGANVGSCYLTDATTGAGVNVTSGRVWPNLMKPSRDVAPFLVITKSVGRDPYATKVSCPIAGAGGYGGAMGPAQFIASTWALIESRIESDLGISSADPWNPEHALMASGILLADRGAIAGSYTSEITAACRYYGTGGSSCSYGKQVMAKTAQIQQNINIINGN